MASKIVVGVALAIAIAFVVAVKFINDIPYKESGGMDLRKTDNPFPLPDFSIPSLDSLSQYKITVWFGNFEEVQNGTITLTLLPPPMAGKISKFSY